MAAKRQATGRPPRMVLYYRKSSELQAHSIERQHAELDPYAAKKAWNVVAKVEDEDIGGSEVARRVGLQEILAMARAGKIDGIGVDDWDRLLRLDLLEMGELLSPLRRAGVFIESVAQGRFDYESMTGRLQMGITSEAKHGELQSIARRTLTEHLRMARDLGEPPLPKPCYGYRREEDTERPLNRNGKRPGKYVLDEREAEVVRMIFTWYIEGHTPGRIVKELRRRCVPSPTGRDTWDRTTIRNMLDNPAYIGDRAYGKFATGKFFHQEGGIVVPTVGPRDRRRRPPEEWLLGTETHAAIIDRELWERVQVRRALSRARDVLDADGNVLRRDGEASTPNADPGAFTLSRLLVCGECGSWMTGFLRSEGKRVNAYVCTRYMRLGADGCVRCEVREAEAVKKLVDRLRTLLASDRQEFLRRRLRERLAAGQLGNHLGSLRKRVAALAGQLTRYRQRLLEVSRDMLPEVEEGIRLCREQHQQAEEELQRAEAADPVKDLEVAVEAAVNAVWTLERALESGNRLSLREALRGIVEKVTVSSETYQTTTGKTRRKPSAIEVTLRRGTGLDLLADLESSCSETLQVLHIDLLAPSGSVPSSVAAS